MHRPIHIGILAGALTGNRGSEAMVLSCVATLRQEFPDATLHVISYSPDSDKEEAEKLGVRLHSCTPLALVFHWFPISLLCFLMPFLIRAPRGNRDSLFGLLSLDAVWDVAGVSFIDNRQRFLPFNCLTLLPFLLLRVPVFKVSQSLGPAKRQLTRFLAKVFLNRVEILCARGRKTLSHLQPLQLRCQVLPSYDASFALEEVSTESLSNRRQLVIIAPSSLIATQHPEYALRLAHCCAQCLSLGYEVELLAHSWRADDGHRNNDLPTCEKVAAEVHRLTGRVPRIVGKGKGALELREEIGKARLLLASRYHALIAGLATRTPSLSVGWGHKYEEALEAFEMSAYHVDFQDFEETTFRERIVQTLHEAESISRHLDSLVPAVIRDCRNTLAQLCNATRAHLKERET